MMIIEEALRFIESEEMREHLRQHDPDRVQFGLSCNIVCQAPAPLEEKLKALEVILEKFCETYGKNHLIAKKFDLNKLPRLAKLALDERYRKVEGAQLLVVEHREDIIDFDHMLNLKIISSDTTTAPVTDFNAALEYIFKSNLRHLPSTDDLCNDKYYVSSLKKGLWFEIEKWVPSEWDTSDTGGLKLSCKWVVNGFGEIWYFWLNEYDKYFKTLAQDSTEELLWFALRSRSLLDAITPFQPGDIVEIDSMPFQAPFRAVITHVNNNRGCQDVKCLYIEHNRLKLSSLARLSHYTGRISPFFRAAIFQDELPENERDLDIISRAIKGRSGGEQLEK